MTAITQGAVVHCRANGNMEHDFVGTVRKCYENSVLVMIEQFDPQDRMNARDLLFQAIVSRRTTTIITPGIPEPESETAADAG